MADVLHLLIERALEHLDEPEMAAILTKQQSRPGLFATHKKWAPNLVGVPIFFLRSPLRGFGKRITD